MGMFSHSPPLCYLQHLFATFLHTVSHYHYAKSLVISRHTCCIVVFSDAILVIKALF